MSSAGHSASAHIQGRTVAADWFPFQPEPQLEVLPFPIHESQIQSSSQISVNETVKDTSGSTSITCPFTEHLGALEPCCTKSTSSLQHIHNIIQGSPELAFDLRFIRWLAKHHRWFCLKCLKSFAKNTKTCTNPAAKIDDSKYEHTHEFFLNQANSRCSLPTFPPSPTSEAGSKESTTTYSWRPFDLDPNIEDTIRRTIIASIKHVPNAVKRLWGQAVLEEIRAVTQNPCDRNAIARFHLLPKCLLSSVPKELRGKIKQGKWTKDLIRQWTSSEIGKFEVFTKVFQRPLEVITRLRNGNFASVNY